MEGDERRLDGLLNVRASVHSLLDEATEVVLCHLVTQKIKLWHGRIGLQYDIRFTSNDLLKEVLSKGSVDEAESGQSKRLHSFTKNCLLLYNS